MSLLGFRKGSGRAATEQHSEPRILSDDIMKVLTGNKDLPEREAADRREFARICVGKRALLCAAASVGEPLPVVLRDLSNTGVGLLVDSELPPGAEFWIYIPKAGNPDDYVGACCEIARCDPGGFELSAFVVAATFIEGEPAPLPDSILKSHEAEESAEPQPKKARKAPRANSSIFSASSAEEIVEEAAAKEVQAKAHAKAKSEEQLDDPEIAAGPARAKKADNKPEASQAPEHEIVFKETLLPSIEGETAEADVTESETSDSDLSESEVSESDSSEMDDGEVHETILESAAEPEVEIMNEPAPVEPEPPQVSSTPQPLPGAGGPATPATEAAAMGKKLTWHQVRRMARMTHAQLNYLQQMGTRLDHQHARTNEPLRKDVEQARRALAQLNARLNSLRNPEAEAVSEKCARRAARHRKQARQQAGGGAHPPSNSTPPTAN